MVTVYIIFPLLRLDTNWLKTIKWSLIENLELKAGGILTVLYVTHVSIIVVDDKSTHSATRDFFIPGFWLFFFHAIAKVIRLNPIINGRLILSRLIWMTSMRYYSLIFFDGTY